jgi:predicted protein tyrosine phosphatase
MTQPDLRPRLVTSSEYDLPPNAAQLQPTRIVSVVFDPPPEAEILAHGWSGSWHHVAIDDISGPKAEEVMRPAARQLVELGRMLTSDDRVLLHCHAGRSRSPAAAIILDLAYEQEQVQYLSAESIETAIVRHAQQERILPNLALCQAADACLGTAGRLSTAIEKFRADRLQARLITRGN